MARTSDATISLASVAAHKAARDRERELRHANIKLSSSGSETSIEEQCRVAFNAFDADGSGCIDQHELQQAMKSLGIDVGKDELRRMMQEVDDDGSGNIEFPEFLELMTGQMGEAKVSSTWTTALDSMKAKMEDAIALYDASVVNDIEEVEDLLQRGADPNLFRTQQGSTALLHAAAYGFAEVVGMLVEYGADCAARNRFGETPIEAARAAGHRSAVELLPGGKHSGFDKPNSRKTPCRVCGKVMGVGRPGVFCVACGTCRKCSETRTCVVKDVLGRGGVRSAVSGLTTKRMQDTRSRDVPLPTRCWAELYVRVVQASDLASADANGLSDPYCVLRCAQQREQTRVIPATLDPTWDEEFVLPLCEGKGDPVLLHCELWDRDISAVGHVSADYLGQVEIYVPCHSAALRKLEDCWHPVTRGEVPDDDGEEDEALRLYEQRLRTENADMEGEGADTDGGAGVGPSSSKPSTPAGRRRSTVASLTTSPAALRRGSSSGALPVPSPSSLRRSSSSGALPVPSPSSLRRSSTSGVLRVPSPSSLRRSSTSGAFGLLRPSTGEDSGDGSESATSPSSRRVSRRASFIDSLASLANTRAQEVQVSGKLRLQLLLRPLDTRVTVHVHDAAGIAAGDLNGLSDPYLEVRLGCATMHTRVVFKTLSPKWDEKLTFRTSSWAVDTNAQLLLRLFDRDLVGTDDYLGEASIPLASLLDGSHAQPKMHPFSGVLNKQGERAKGSVRLSSTHSRIEGAPSLKRADTNDESFSFVSGANGVDTWDVWQPPWGPADPNEAVKKKKKARRLSGTAFAIATTARRLSGGAIEKVAKEVKEAAPATIRRRSSGAGRRLSGGDGGGGLDPSAMVTAVALEEAEQARHAAQAQQTRVAAPSSSPSPAAAPAPSAATCAAMEGLSPLEARQRRRSLAAADVKARRGSASAVVVPPTAATEASRSSEPGRSSAGSSSAASAASTSSSLEHWHKVGIDQLARRHSSRGVADDTTARYLVAAAEQLTRSYTHAAEQAAHAQRQRQVLEQQLATVSEALRASRAQTRAAESKLEQLQAAAKPGASGQRGSSVANGGKRRSSSIIVAKKNGEGASEEVARLRAALAKEREARQRAEALLEASSPLQPQLAAALRRMPTDTQREAAMAEMALGRYGVNMQIVVVDPQLASSLSAADGIGAVPCGDGAAPDDVFAPPSPPPITPTASVAAAATSPRRASVNPRHVPSNSPKGHCSIDSQLVVKTPSFIMTVVRAAGAAHSFRYTHADHLDTLRRLAALMGRVEERRALQLQQRWRERSKRHRAVKDDPPSTDLEPEDDDVRRVQWRELQSMMGSTRSLAAMLDDLRALEDGNWEELAV